MNSHVGDGEQCTVERNRRTFATAAGALALAALATGCGAGGGDSASSPATTAAPLASVGATAPATAPGSSDAAGSAATAALWRKWGLKPLAPAPAPPAVPPIKLTRTGTVPVIDSVPTHQKIVFITLDDGLEKDPKFVEMMRELKVPFTMFLMNDAIKSDYGYFKPLQALGNSIQNHTLHHPAMNTVSEDRQKQEVCGDQKILTTQYGTAPFLFRPPYGAGAHTASLNAAVQACGPRAIVYWKESMQITGVQYQTSVHKFQDGDIILAHFRGPAELKGETMTKMFANLIKRIEEQGFTVARLDDYIQKP
ncbi:polysaccharide deacetylase family protein [Streptacidiphilus cavernicola]|uniref:Polysaccharide deacetylase family protein n=1 Tax=Streptacidiphilus cavernicola TaxID=3342716 RepID=A0ABV6VTT3_9ACTN